MIFLFLVASALLGFTWAGYPLLMGGLAAMRRDKPRAGSAPLASPVTVLIASRDAAPAIAARVADVRTTDHPGDRLQVIVALDVGALPGGPDGAAALAYAAEVSAAVGDGARVVRGGAPGGKASALNAGVAAAGTDILVLTDTHQRFTPTTIPALVAALAAEPRLGAVSGALETRAPGERPGLADRYWALEKRLRHDEAIVHSTVGVTGAVYAIRRVLYPRLPDGLILDDLYVPMTVVLGGHRVGFLPEARATDTRRFTTEQEYRRKVRTLTGVWQLCAWLPAVLVPGRNPIWLQFVAHKLLRLLTPWLALVAAVAGGIPVTRWLWRLDPRLVGAGAVAGALALVAPGIGRRVRNLLHSLLAMQAAIVVATVNGVRGRWAVWR